MTVEGAINADDVIQRRTRLDLVWEDEARIRPLVENLVTRISDST
jgi:hypothetical protein